MDRHLFTSELRFHSVSAHYLWSLSSFGFHTSDWAEARFPVSPNSEKLKVKTSALIIYLGQTFPLARGLITFCLWIKLCWTNCCRYWTGARFSSQQTGPVWRQDSSHCRWPNVEVAGERLKRGRKIDNIFKQIVKTIPSVPVGRGPSGRWSTYH